MSSCLRHLSAIISLLFARNSFALTLEINIYSLKNQPIILLKIIPKLRSFSPNQMLDSDRRLGLDEPVSGASNVPVLSSEDKVVVSWS
ncbi:hypothetical protein GQ43DRAFT_439284 [Delitschia confertaspora ATCC 74209]|uniref:Uncharacterized protein n=1 Tax=Delitschia confertaspora ATCC 74209 TaxID=1513339 RepID=A0A9P4JR84_9PLEO|nr:hypothetical protein GQ43DRAFT_439284 [Delitschia confertaspora ATCC 74209]